MIYDNFGGTRDPLKQNLDFNLAETETKSLESLGLESVTEVKTDLKGRFEFSVFMLWA